MTDTPAEQGLPPALRFLKGLVIVLMITMIAGVITITAVLVTRMPDANAAPTLPERITLPDGKEAEAVTIGKGWVGVVTRDGHFLIFGADGALRQDVEIAP